MNSKTLSLLQRKYMLMSFVNAYLITLAADSYPVFIANPIVLRFYSTV